MRPLGWAFIQQGCVLIKRGNWTKTQTERENIAKTQGDWHLQAKRCLKLSQARREAGDTFSLNCPCKEPTLSQSGSWISSLQAVRQLMSGIEGPQFMALCYSRLWKRIHTAVLVCTYLVRLNMSSDVYWFYFFFLYKMPVVVFGYFALDLFPYWLNWNSFFILDFKPWLVFYSSLQLVFFFFF